MGESVAILDVRVCGKELEQLSARVIDGFAEQAGPSGTNSVQSEARLVQQEGAGGPRSRQVVLGQSSGNTTQPGSGPVNQARQLMVF